MRRSPDTVPLHSSCDSANKVRRGLLTLATFPLESMSNPYTSSVREGGVSRLANAKGSGWLTPAARIGDPVTARIRVGIARPGGYHAAPQRSP